MTATELAQKVYFKAHDFETIPTKPFCMNRFTILLLTNRPKRAHMATLDADILRWARVLLKTLTTTQTCCKWRIDVYGILLPHNWRPWFAHNGSVKVASRSSALCRVTSQPDIALYKNTYTLKHSYVIVHLFLPFIQPILLTPRNIKHNYTPSKPDTLLSIIYEKECPLGFIYSYFKAIFLYACGWVK